MPLAFFSRSIFQPMEKHNDHLPLFWRLDRHAVLARMSTVAPLIGWPFLIDIKKTSLLPSVFFFVKIPMSVTRRNLLSLTDVIGFFFTGSQPRAVRKNRPRSLRRLPVCEDARKNRMPNNSISICFECNRLLLESNPRDILLIDRWESRIPVFESTLGLADEVVDLSRSNTCDLEFDP